MISQYGQSSPFGQPPQSQYAMMSPYSQGSPFGQPHQAQYGYAQPMYNMYGGPQHTPVNLMTGEATRTIYLGNVTKTMNVHDILNYVRTGLIESFRTCYEKACAFLAFVDPNSAQAFFQEYLTKKIIVNNTEIKLGWGKANSLSNTLKLQIQGGATRCVYLGRLTDANTEEEIRKAAMKYGPLEHVKIIRDKNIAFVHFLSIAAACKCVSALSKEPEWVHVRVNYGKDHCSGNNDYNPYGYQPFQTPQQQQQQQLAYEPYSYASSMQPNVPPVSPGTTVLRTLYMGNIHPDAKTEDLCNTIRGGNLLQIRHFPEKHIAFVTFMDASTALEIYNYAQTTGLTVRGRKLRVGWGKPSSISIPVAQAIQQGATRNIYVGNIPESLTVDKLKKDFASFGEIELVNAFKEKKCAFVNFTSIGNAVTAINAMRLNPEYADYKLNYGKDRCGNPFRPATSRKNATPVAAANEGNDAAVKQDEVEEGAISAEKPLSIVADIPEPPPPASSAVEKPATPTEPAAQPALK